MVEKEERDEIDVFTSRRQRIVERPRQRDDVLHRAVFMRASKRSLARALALKVLAVDLAAWPDRARHQLGAVAAAGAHIEHRHAALDAGEGQQLHRIAALIGLAVGVGAVGRGDDGGIVLRQRDLPAPPQQAPRQTPERTGMISHHAAFLPGAKRP